MKYTLKYYVDSIFEGTPDTEAVRELHDEILSNLEARYDDCINGGMSPQRAYAAVIGTMGDVSNLIDQVSGSGFHVKGSYEKKSPVSRLMKKYSYIFTDKNLGIIKRAAIAVMWLLTVAFYILISWETQDWDYTWIIFLMGAAVTVGLNMAGNIARISKGGESNRTRIKLLKAVHRGASAIMWLGIVVIYFLISWDSYEWNVTWIIFILGAAAQVIINAVFKIQINRYKS